MSVCECECASVNCECGSVFTSSKMNALCGLYTLIKRNFCATQLRNNVKDVKETATERKAEGESETESGETRDSCASLCGRISRARNAN